MNPLNPEEAERWLAEQVQLYVTKMGFLREE